MIGAALLAIGLVLVIEGLVYALAPSLVEQLLEALRALPEGQRRTLGLIALGSGVVLIWLGKALGA
ncbi:DUF2065 domain-containing protein [uncultured Shimia sp.]|uniref:DUF2065 domain-containing protein n=1 Tax=uncultured Shimia sp. TaxID=573152 RepID=UPI00263076F1|nr:DUF2065 domain-containing protein [uncultured Shimia sp.]